MNRIKKISYKTSKKIMIFVSIFAFVFTLAFNLSFIIKQNGQIEKINLVTNNAKAFIAPDYHLEFNWQGHECFICYEGGLSCDVSAQCCIDHEPYC